MAIRYHICHSPLSWSDPAAIHHAKQQPGTANHRSIVAAHRAHDGLQAKVKRSTGMQLDTRILARVDDGYRRLTLEEQETLSL